MRLFKCESSHALDNAQRNLMGRTHYVDPETLRWHKSRVLSARHTDDGLLFAITTSDALDMHNTKRGFRYVVFDVFGTVVSRDKLEDAHKRHEQAVKAMWAFLNAFDAVSHTRQAIAVALDHYRREMKYLYSDVDKIAEKIGHAKANEAVGSKADEAINDYLEQH